MKTSVLQGRSVLDREVPDRARTALPPALPHSCMAFISRMASKAPGMGSKSRKKLGASYTLATLS